MKRGFKGRACDDRTKAHAKEDARERRGRKGRTPDPNAESVVRAAEHAERQAGKREAMRQQQEDQDDG